MNMVFLFFRRSVARGSRLSLLLAIFFVQGAQVHSETPTAEDYPAPIKSVIEQRCMVCHGCYDAPCQLKMDAWIGLQRGASKDKVYNGTRLLPANLTRLYEDALSIEEWREKDFYPVLDDSDPHQGVMYQMLKLKQENPSPSSGKLPDSFDFSLDRDQSCPKAEEFAEYREERPLQGMPYGFPGLDADRQALLTEWLEAGAPGTPLPPRPDDELRAIDAWETFLNAPDNKSRLMSRYIFEHLFIGDLYFEDLGADSAWYKLVRSRTAPGQPIDLIATRRPYDKPGTDSFYYRLQPRYISRLAKRHMPYALSEARMERWKALFLEPDYEVTSLPGYKGKHAANPFINFQQLPVEARYRFMLEEAHFTIMAYIKGPVCRGQVALNVIDDHFWVAFVRPNAADPEQRADFLAAEAQEMRLPQAKGSLAITALQWRGYAKSQQKFLKAQAKAIAKVVDQQSLQLDMDLIWDGGPEENDNAALTVFRHFDSATVVKGFVGQQPQTMWVIDYSLLERIHYLLVAGFDVYGAVGHQLESRLYMDFLRMEGEQAFLLFLPEGEREAVRNHWYRGATDDVKKYIISPKLQKFERPSAIEFQTDDPKSELMAMFKARIPAGRRDRYAVNQKALEALMQGQGRAFSFMPEVSFLRILSARGDDAVYSLIANRAHSNNAQLFAEEDRRLPEEDTLTVTEGFVGAYPNMFFQINESQLPKFSEALRSLASLEDYTALVDAFGVRRTAPWFWKLSDDLTAQYKSSHPLEAGLFDLNRYQNR
ncbi:fatty acid cis/trans isomerase [Congregibacter litoralis]|uniref:Fatty acid cis/trans isomerase (CTI) n=1 Tax=Congregibacter litoralis KT71 TaxID=314285 RepID=A4A7A7_9GAMM|nr:fatty acid cis/trans isomerase [Congregibacter litoralis]EAQ98176.1 Fatty acid cis/trans isomerase (CTI) [Congregibacter litoralis KT71]